MVLTDAYGVMATAVVRAAAQQFRNVHRFPHLRARGKALDDSGRVPLGHR